MAKEELLSLAQAMRSRIQEHAEEKANQPIQYYVAVMGKSNPAHQQETQFSHDVESIIIAATSLEEAILNVDNYLMKLSSLIYR
jgi:hypothetical protein